MDRPIIYSQQQGRSFDVMNGWKDTLKSFGHVAQGMLGSTPTICHGFSAAQQSSPDLTIALASGEIYEWEEIDATPWGALDLDTNFVYQIGHAPAQTIEFSLDDLVAGQSKWALVQVGFTQPDSVRTGDPTNGLLPYYNSANPADPLQGPGGTGTTQSTVRKAFADVKVTYGVPAPTGQEAPPIPLTGYVGLYLIDLTFGQTTILTNEIFVAGPTVTSSAPTYPDAPFLAGLLSAHHNGKTGQAPKIMLTNALEVQGILPLANLPATDTIGVLSCFRVGHGSPQSVLAGQQGDTYGDLDTGDWWFCSVSGSIPGSTTWITGSTGSGDSGSSPPSGSGSPSESWTLIPDADFPFAPTGYSGNFVLMPTGNNRQVNLATGANASRFRFKNFNTNGYVVQINSHSSELMEGSSNPIKLTAEDEVLGLMSETTTPQWFVF